MLVYFRQRTGKNQARGGKLGSAAGTASLPATEDTARQAEPKVGLACRAEPFRCVLCQKVVLVREPQGRAAFVRIERCL